MDKDKTVPFFRPRYGRFSEAVCHMGRSITGRVFSQFLFEQHEIYIRYSVEGTGYDARFPIAEFLIETAGNFVSCIGVHSENAASAIPCTLFIKCNEALSDTLISRRG